MNAAQVTSYFVEGAQEFKKRGVNPLIIVGALEVAQTVMIQSSVRLVPASPIIPAQGPLPPTGEGN